MDRPLPRKASRPLLLPSATLEYLALRRQTWALLRAAVRFATERSNQQIKRLLGGLEFGDLLASLPHIAGTITDEQALLAQLVLQHGSLASPEEALAESGTFPPLFPVPSRAPSIEPKNQDSARTPPTDTPCTQCIHGAEFLTWLADSLQLPEDALHARHPAQSCCVVNHTASHAACPRAGQQALALYHRISITSMAQLYMARDACEASLTLAISPTTCLSILAVSECGVAAQAHASVSPAADPSPKPASGSPPHLHLMGSSCSTATICIVHNLNATTASCSLGRLQSTSGSCMGKSELPSDACYQPGPLPCCTSMPPQSLEGGMEGCTAGGMGACAAQGAGEPAAGGVGQMAFATALAHFWEAWRGDTAGLGALSKSTLTSLLTSDKLQVADESEVFHVVMAWAALQPVPQPLIPPAEEGLEGALAHPEAQQAQVQAQQAQQKTQYDQWAQLARHCVRPGLMKLSDLAVLDAEPAVSDHPVWLKVCATWYIHKIMGEGASRPRCMASISVLKAA